MKWDIPLEFVNKGDMDVLGEKRKSQSWEEMPEVRVQE